MRSGYRSLVRLLSGALLLSTLGCISSQEQADSEAHYLYPGMAQEEVLARLGDPGQIIRGEPGAEVVWIYRFEGGPSTVAVVFLVIFFVLLIAVAVMSRGGGFVGGGGGGSSPPCQIRLRFDGAGRLMDVSPPEPVPGPDGQ